MDSNIPGLTNPEGGLFHFRLLRGIPLKGTRGLYFVNLHMMKHLYAADIEL